MLFSVEVQETGLSFFGGEGGLGWGWLSLENTAPIAWRNVDLEEWLEVRRLSLGSWESRGLSFDRRGCLFGWWIQVLVRFAVS